MPPERHPSVDELMRHFTFDHLPEGPMRETSRDCCNLAQLMYNDHDLDGPELTVGLRKLLEAKDCFVRAAIPAK